MRQEIHLFIGGAEVEFSTPPSILYNYTETDLRKPTAVKNSFSKSITIDGTPQNNDIFGHIWRLDRNQEVGGSVSGPYFNPMIKADFELYSNGELYERGYCKMNSITRSKNDIQYNITLYGGLGGMLQELAYGQGDNNVKKTLADLNFDVADLDFTINKDTVNTAWRQIGGDIDTEDKYDVINFAFTAEGVPSDFGADKVLVNLNGNPDGFTKTSDGYKGIYGSTENDNGYALATAATDLTMDTSLDLRSYLLRPVVNVRAIFDALRRPENNGGYDIRLDDHFFTYQNPYYANAWVTLPKLRDLGIEKTSSESAAVTLTKENENFYRIGNNVSGNNFRFTMQLKMTPNSSTSATDLYQATYMTTNASGHNREDIIKEFQTSWAVIANVVAYDGAGNEVAHSNPVMFCCGDHSVPNTLWSLYDIRTQQGNRTICYGHFKQVNGEWLFCNNEGQVEQIYFDLPQNVTFSSLKLRLMHPWWEWTKVTRGWPGNKQNTDTDSDISSPYPFYTDVDERNISGNYTPAQIRARNRVMGTLSIKGIELSVKSLDYDGMFSGTEIPKSKLLATPYSPADFLLSYCKIFGLYLYKDPVEESSEPLKYPNGVVHIVDRHTFYNDEFVNLTELIDYSKPVTINPTTSETKWYNFAYEDGEGEAEAKYKARMGYPYGRQLVNTGLAFNSDTTELYDEGCFKNGVMVREKNVYFQASQNAIPYYAFDGMKYNLFKVNGTDYDEKEMSYPLATGYAGDLNAVGLPYYDVMPKLQVHSKDNGDEDGSGILLFFNGMLGTPIPYILTDDVSDMGVLNDNEPCWILTASQTDAGGNTIAIPRFTLPFFSRDIYSAGQDGKIYHSWNFGHPAVTYVPNTFTTDFDCVYDKCWRDYMTDLYDVNTKRVTAYVRLGGKPNPVWLRRWYFWENAIWRINAIKDWNVGSYDSTEVEFIKVQDIANYDVEQIAALGRIQVILDNYNIGKDGGTITGRVICQNPSECWTITDGMILWTDAAGNSGSAEAVSPSYACGETTNITITVPANSGSARRYRFSLEDSNDNVYWTYFTQEGDDTPVLNITPSSADVSASGGAYTFTFTAANVNAGSFTVTSSSAFCTATVNEGAQTITCTATPNQGASRSTTITLSAMGRNGNTVTATATLNQGGSDLNVSPLDTAFDYFEDYTTDRHSFTITTDGDWTVTINDN